MPPVVNIFAFSCLYKWFHFNDLFLLHQSSLFALAVFIVPSGVNVTQRSLADKRFPLFWISSKFGVFCPSASESPTWKGFEAGGLGMSVDCLCMQGGAQLRLAGEGIEQQGGLYLRETSGLQKISHVDSRRCLYLLKVTSVLPSTCFGGSLPFPIAPLHKNMQISRSG